MAEAEQFPPNTAAHIIRPDGSVKVVIAAEMRGKHPVRWAKDYYIGRYIVTGYDFNAEGRFLRINTRDIVRADWNAMNVRFPDGTYYNMSDEVTTTPAEYVDKLDKEIDTNDEDVKYTLCKFEFNEATRNFEVELGPLYITLAFQTGENNENEARESFTGDECNYMEEIEADYGNEYDIEEGEYDEEDGTVSVILRELSARERRERRQRRARQEQQRIEREAAAAAAAAAQAVQEARNAERRISRNLPTLLVPMKAKNAITYNNINNNNVMANFHSEYEQKRFYKKPSIDRLMANYEARRKNPFTRVPIMPENITYYKAKKKTYKNNNNNNNSSNNSNNSSNNNNNNRSEGGRRRKRKTRRHNRK